LSEVKEVSWLPLIPFCPLAVNDIRKILPCAHYHREADLEAGVVRITSRLPEPVVDDFRLDQAAYVKKTPGLQQREVIINCDKIISRGEEIDDLPVAVHSKQGVADAMRIAPISLPLKHFETVPSNLIEVLTIVQVIA
jgi:hypothetical protein